MKTGKRNNTEYFYIKLILLAHLSILVDKSLLGSLKFINCIA